MSRGLQIGCHVASLIEHGVARLDRYLFDELANAELVLADYFNADNVLIRIEVQHHETLLRTEGFCRDNFRAAQPDVSRRSFGVDLDNRRFGDWNHETLNAAL